MVEIMGIEIMGIPKSQEDGVLHVISYKNINQEMTNALRVV